MPNELCEGKEKIWILNNSINCLIVFPTLYFKISHIIIKTLENLLKFEGKIIISKVRPMSGVPMNRCFPEIQNQTQQYHSQNVLED